MRTVQWLLFMMNFLAMNRIQEKGIRGGCLFLLGNLFFIENDLDWFSAFLYCLFMTVLSKREKSGGAKHESPRGGKKGAW